VTAYVCTSLGGLHVGGDPIYVGSASAMGCATWEVVTLQVPNTLQIDYSEVALLISAVVGSAVALWVAGQVIGSFIHVLRAAFRTSSLEE
jgi:hypothetical protein